MNFKGGGPENIDDLSRAICSSIDIKWTGVAAQIGEKNRVLDNNSALITKEMAEMGLLSCVLKGQGTALLYPYPEYRQCGDIDLWIHGNHRNLVRQLSKKWTIGSVHYHHADVKAFDDKTKLEVHFKPSWLNDPFGNRHLLQEGIGLRQLMDYYFVLVNCTATERRNAYAFAEKLGMKRFVRAMMYVLQRVFLMEDELLLCPPDEKSGEFLLNEIMIAGNFGLFDKRNKYRVSQTLPLRATYRMLHLSRFFHIASSEVLWAPFFKTYQFVWRRLNGYNK